jgi:hypothetical protein
VPPFAVSVALGGYAKPCVVVKVAGTAFNGLTITRFSMRVVVCAELPPESMT